MIYGRPRDLIIGESAFTNVLDKLEMLKEDLKYNKNDEFQIWIQFTENDPTTFKDDKTGESINYTSTPNGLIATIKREDLMNYDPNSPVIHVTFKKEHIAQYYDMLRYKGFGGSIQPSKEYFDHTPVPKHNDIETDLYAHQLGILYTDMQKILVSPDKKYTRKELLDYALLHGPYLLWKLIQMLEGEERRLAESLFIDVFGYEMYEMFAKEKLNSVSDEEKFNKKHGDKYSYLIHKRYKRLTSSKGKDGPTKGDDDGGREL